MASRRIFSRFDETHLRLVLAGLFLALLVPTAILIRQAYGQLKWEAHYQYRVLAEELTGRIETALRESIAAEEARSFADYAFLVVTGNPDAGFLQRSALAEYPPNAELPGVIGHFQIGSDGTFSSPLVPESPNAPEKLGIDPQEHAQRLALAAAIREVLQDNRLIRYPARDTAGRELDSGIPSSQMLFDELGKSRDRTGGNAPAEPELNAPGADAETPVPLAGTRRNVADLRLDERFEKKSSELEQERAGSKREFGPRVAAPARVKRKEQIALPQTAARSEEMTTDDAAGRIDYRVRTFESEIDPFEFGLLDSGHFVLFRKVWREGERYIQGMLIDQPAFVRELIGKRFEATALSATSSLIVAYRDELLMTLVGAGISTYSVGFEAPGDSLLYRARLQAPLDALEVLFSVERLPFGPGANVLGWMTLVLGIVFGGGFYTLYRLGQSQIRLARQQQDFVSAVSHELKTPLTSIRMYGEMLKEGWAAPDKRQTYYEFIYDESERLARLIANVLRLSKITRNDPQFDLRAIGGSELLDQIASKVESQAQRAGFELRFDRSAEADNAIVEIDADCFAQIVINLVDNAIKFSSDAEPRRIDISSRVISEGKLLVTVRDYGPGIARDQMKKIFRLFYRSENELTRETVGTGIGLAIVHELTSAMGGSVDVVNREPGAEFRLTFPQSG